MKYGLEKLDLKNYNFIEKFERGLLGSSTLYENIKGERCYLKFLLLPNTTLEALDKLSKNLLKFKSSDKLPYQLIPINNVFYHTDERNILYFVIETKYIEYTTSLRNILDGAKDIKMNDLVLYLIDIFKALNYLNTECKIAHFNIKPENIIINQVDKKAYLMDYYLLDITDTIAVVMNQMSDTRFSNYVTPEMWKSFIQSNISQEYKNLFKVDVFSTLLSFYPIIDTCFQILNLSKVMAFDKTFEFDKAFTKITHEWLSRLIRSTLSPLYQERCYVNDVLIYLEDIRDSYFNDNENFEKEENEENKKFEEDRNIDIKMEDMLKKEDIKDDIKGVKNCEIKKVEIKNDVSKFQEESFNVHFTSRLFTDKILVILIGKKLKKEYKNLKVIDFDQNKLSTMDNCDHIEDFVNDFPDIRFLLLNIDDIDNIYLKINKAFNYITKLIGTNKDKYFIIYTYTSFMYNEAISTYVLKQLDICKEYNNTIYVSSAGNQGIITDDTLKNLRFPQSLNHPLKICIGSVDKSNNISKSSNRGKYVDYYAFSTTDTIYASSRVVLMCLLLWNYNPLFGADKILDKVKEESIFCEKKNSSFKLLDYSNILDKLEKEHLREELFIRTLLNKDQLPVIIDEIILRFDISLLNQNIIKINHIPTSIRIEFNIMNIQYDIKIINDKVNTFIQYAEFRKSSNDGNKKILNDVEKSKIKYALNSDKFCFHVVFHPNGITLRVDNNNIYQEYCSLDLLKLKGILIKKTDNISYFKNITINHKKHSIKNNTIENMKVIEKNIEYDQSVAVLFIVNIFQKKQFTLFTENVYKFIQLLLQKNFKIYIICGYHSTHMNLMKTFDSIKKTNSKMSRFIFYYYGHTKYVNEESLMDNYSLTSYTRPDDQENLIAYQQLMNDIKNLPFTHKWTIIESCYSSKLIDIQTTSFETDHNKIQEKCNYIITAKNEISTKGDVIEEIMSIIEIYKKEYKKDNIPLHVLFNLFNKHYKEKESKVKFIMRKEGSGDFFFNASSPSVSDICGNFITIPLNNFNETKFNNWLELRL